MQLYTGFIFSGPNLVAECVEAIRRSECVASSPHWPDEPTRIALSSLSDHVRQRVEHRRVSRPDDLHLTLSFIGDLAKDVALDLSDAIAKLRFPRLPGNSTRLDFSKKRASCG